MRSFEDPERITSLLIAAAKQDALEARPVDRNGRQLADDLADGGQRHGLVWFKSDNADKVRGPGTGQNLREKPGLSAAGLARHDRGAGRSIVPRAADERRDRIELLLTADERRAHDSNGVLVTCAPSTLDIRSLYGCPGSQTRSMRRPNGASGHHLDLDWRSRAPSIVPIWPSSATVQHRPTTPTPRA